jgi:hypothetical protein
LKGEEIGRKNNEIQKISSLGSLCFLGEEFKEKEGTGNICSKRLERFSEQRFEVGCDDI